ncbi:alanine aminotransferase 1-like [Coccinella septempunctata]|uniref:alanine aminotransferase 1-like n=1 Tax=Coccinella septempunctata TaxID=41139 RepID=UPI001D065B17|nr:alanine aminotransferase 1-like [Coccinella septempunctata]
MLNTIKVELTLTFPYRSISHSAKKLKKKIITIDNIHQGIRNMEVPLRYPILHRAQQLEEEVKRGAEKHFKKVYRANLADSQAMGQKPLTFLRQVLILVTYPGLMKDSRFASDAKERARIILASCRGHSIGSYSECSGIDIIRRHCAEFIERRDGIHSDWQNITLSSGSSEAIRNVLKLIAWKVDKKPTGVLMPIPQFPLYKAFLQDLLIHPVRYYLSEEKNWSVDVEELKRAYEESKNICTPRALLVINPGNPTGHVLTLQNIQEIIKFAFNHSLLILADEVYQENIYIPTSTFHSFKRVLIEMGPPYSEVELASFMSVSHGYAGESGLRGGYVEIVNMSPDVYEMYLKLLCLNLCPSVLGQVALDVVVYPPREDEPSFEDFSMEKNEIMDSYKRRAKLFTDTIRDLEGISCNPIEGAFYVFPKIAMSPKAVQAARHDKKVPDLFYAHQLLEKTGVCVVPGSCFGQKKDTWHFRATILLPECELVEMLKGFREFHVGFMDRYK